MIRDRRNNRSEGDLVQRSRARWAVGVFSIRFVIAAAAMLATSIVASCDETGAAAETPPDIVPPLELPNDLIWGVNGHPNTAYGIVTLDEQMAAISRLGMTYYRVGAALDKMDAMMAAAARHKVALLPVIDAQISLEFDSPETIYNEAYRVASLTASRYKGRVKVWELGNEMEGFAIIHPCELRDDGTIYPCEWGPAGGTVALDYFGARWKKVSAALKGFSDGVHAGDPDALRAIGTAGWGHSGAFERLKADGVQWDISVWHMYRTGEDEWAFKKLAEYGKPIWITEFNHPKGSWGGTEKEQAEGLKKMMAELRAMRTKYRITTAIVYELLDEPYWKDYEGTMGLIGMRQNSEGAWIMEKDKPAAEAVRSTIAAGK